MRVCTTAAAGALSRAIHRMHDCCSWCIVSSHSQHARLLQLVHCLGGCTDARQVQLVHCLWPGTACTNGAAGALYRAMHRMHDWCSWCNVSAHALHARLLQLCIVSAHAPHARLVQLAHCLRPCTSCMHVYCSWCIVSPPAVHTCTLPRRHVRAPRCVLRLEVPPEGGQILTN